MAILNNRDIGIYVNRMKIDKIKILLPSKELAEPPQFGQAMAEKEINKKNMVLNKVIPQFH